MSKAVTPPPPMQRTVRTPVEEMVKFEGAYACVLAYNDEARIGEVVRQALRHCGRVIVCDDGSRDGTAAEAMRAGALVIHHETNLGKGKSVSDLVNEVVFRSPTGVVLVEREGFGHADEVTILLRTIMKDEADIAVGMSGMGGIGSVDAGITAMNPKALFALTKEGFFSSGTSPQTALAAVAGLRVKAVTLRGLVAGPAAPEVRAASSPKPAGGRRLSYWSVLLDRDFLAMGIPAFAFTCVGLWLLAAFLIPLSYTGQATVAQQVRGVVGLTSIIFGMAFMVSYIVSYSVRHASRERKE